MVMTVDTVIVIIYLKQVTFKELFEGKEKKYIDQKSIYRILLTVTSYCKKLKNVQILS